MFEYVATVGFCYVGTGWNSFRYVDGKMSPEPPVGEILIFGELFLYICNILKKESNFVRKRLTRESRRSSMMLIKVLVHSVKSRHAALVSH